MNILSEFNFIKQTSDGVVISVRIIPNSSKNSVIGYANEYLKLKISSPPIENKANKKLLEYMSEIFSVPKSKIKFIFGEKSKIKRLLLSGLTIEDAITKIVVYDKIEE